MEAWDACEAPFSCGGLGKEGAADIRARGDDVVAVVGKVLAAGDFWLLADYSIALDYADFAIVFFYDPFSATDGDWLGGVVVDGDEIDEWVRFISRRIQVWHVDDIVDFDA